VRRFAEKKSFNSAILISTVEVNGDKVPSEFFTNVFWSLKNLKSTNDSVSLKKLLCSFYFYTNRSIDQG
jgi:hypothetical protein